MIIVIAICGIILVLAAIGTIYRLARGPSLLDRVIASDVLLAIVGAGLVLDMVYRDSYENVTLLIVISLVGFLGSVTVARFANNQREKDDARGSSAASTTPASRGPGGNGRASGGGG
ncbi:monovalent cation/H+ antiporter complex subunit F [Curtobacterium sp. S6]|uniref:monovalent cation/H+ antiporter complex subunit F n=1 Tax=Curtobacterium sp. S6 TaxID=1479623 RepID=UPI0009E94432|nr:monovalent cation/H+ antiporter complex subunit F [Curtobacterium sp. S6]